MSELLDALCVMNEFANYFCTQQIGKRTAVIEKVQLALSENAKKEYSCYVRPDRLQTSLSFGFCLSNHEPVMEPLGRWSDEPGSTGTKAAGFLTKTKTFERYNALKVAHKVLVVTATIMQSKR
jgi:hypothetical protein